MALYTASHSTEPIAGLHHANVYVYCAVAAFVGSAPLYTGVAPYSTSLFCNCVPFSSSNTISYFLNSSSNCAVYVAHVVTSTIAGDHHVKLYVHSAVAAFVGSAPL